jgi:protein-tyrosine phosphatase
MSSILFVCTGNICRSPMAEGLFRALLLRRGIGAAVSSAGTSVQVGRPGEDAGDRAGGPAGWPAEDDAVRAAAERGADISGHRARGLERHHIEDADLIVCMAAPHIEEVIGLSPEAGSRTFGLKELVLFLEDLPPVEALPEMGQRVRAADALRRNAPWRDPGDLDVADPLGMPLDLFRAVAWDIEEWSGRLATGLFGAESRHPDLVDEPAF